MENVSSGNTIRNSLEKIDNYLQQKEGFIVLTQLAQDLNLHFRSVKKCISTLQKLNRVEVVTNGNITLIKFKGEIKNAGIQTTN